MARVNVNILGISELKWTRMGEFNSDDHYIYYCGQESLRRNGVTIMVNKRVWNAVLGCNLKKDRIISVRFQGCREPPREIAPMTRSCGRELLSKASELNGLPRLSQASTPQTRICLFYYFMTFTNSSDINRGATLITFLWRKSTYGYS